MKRNDLLTGKFNIADMVTKEISDIHSTFTVESTEKEELLTAYTKEYKALSASANKVSRAYSLRAGEILKAIKDGKLYEARNYKGVGDFAEKELGVSKATASTSIKVVEMVSANNDLPAPLDLESIPYKLLSVFATNKAYTWENKERAIAMYKDGFSVNAILDELKKALPLSKAETKAIAEKSAREAHAQDVENTVKSAIAIANERRENARANNDDRLFKDYLSLVIGLPNPEQYTRLYTQLSNVWTAFDRMYASKVEMTLKPFQSISIDAGREYDETQTLAYVFDCQNFLTDLRIAEENSENSVKSELESSASDKSYNSLHGAE